MMFIVLKVKEWVVKMKIGVISDLHIDRHSHLMPKAYITTLCDVVKQRDIEMLIIAGDISNHYQRSYQFIKQLEANSEISVVFIPGNHDFWIDETDQSSAEILEFYQSKAECLIGNPHIINDSWAIVGHTGWYDYSYADSRFSRYEIERGQHYGATWQDKVRTDWSISDQQLSINAAKRVESDIKKVGNRQIILVTHVVTHPQFVVPTPHRIFDFFNAFIGTHDFDQIYENYPIRYSIMGHVHFRKKLYEHGIHYICPCLGYQRQWRTQDIVKEMNDALVEFHI